MTLLGRTAIIVWAYTLNAACAAGQLNSGVDRVHCRSSEERIEAYLFQGNGGPSYEADLDYYWYKDLKIHHSKGGCGGRLLHGQFTAFYLNGQLKRSGQFRKGLMHGEWRFWDIDGEPNRMERWKRGHLKVDHDGAEGGPTPTLDGQAKEVENTGRKAERRKKRGIP